MKKKLLLLITSLALFLTSCITIEETYTFKEDGSGASSFTIDMSGIKRTMDALGAGAENPHLDKLKAMDFATYKQTITNIEGITNINTGIDKDNYIFSLTYDFVDQSSLNTVLNTILETEEQTYFKHKKKNRCFKVEHPLPVTFKKSLKDINSKYISGFLKKINYKMVMNFEQKVKRVKTKAYSSHTDNQVIVESNLSELLDNPDLLKARIRVK